MVPGETSSVCQNRPRRTPHGLGFPLFLRNRCGFQVRDRMMHARHPPLAIRLLAHRHAAAVQLAFGGVNRKFVLVPNGFAYGMKGALEDFQLCRRLLVKITLAEISYDLLPAIEFGIDGE